MKNKSESGWLMSLRDEAESAWGSVDGFISDIESCPKRNGAYLLESDVWGRIGPKEILPTKGQGIAFYHSTRAKFPSPDNFGRKPRITLIGQILDVELEGKEVTHLKVSIEESVLKHMKSNPIVREGAMIEVFEECGIKQGSVATFYFAGPEQWKIFLSHI
jgi:hypothetical protein